MEVNIQSIGNIAVVYLKGRFDAYQVEGVKQKLYEVMDASPRIVVELGGVSFLDSAALAVLVQGMKHCRNLGGDLKIANIQGPVRIIFEVTRLDKAFDIFPSDKVAAAAFV